LGLARGGVSNQEEEKGKIRNGENLEKREKKGDRED